MKLSQDSCFLSIKRNVDLSNETTIKNQLYTVNRNFWPESRDKSEIIDMCVFWVREQLMGQLR